MKDWTIMVYMAGDNNLSQDMITAINGIKGGISAAGNINFLIQFDCEHPIVKTKRYDVFNGTEEDINESADTAKAIREFVLWGLRPQFKADHYALIISGHSDAYQGKTLLVDENPNSIASLGELKTALTDAEIKAGLPSGELDILGFDSCVMNTIEVLYEMRDVASIWIGSQGSIPNYTWDYYNIAKTLNDLSATGNVRPSKVIEIIVEKVKSYNFEYAFGGRSIDISACRLDNSDISSVLTALDDLGGYLIDEFRRTPEISISGFNDEYSLVRRLLTLAHFQCQTYMYEQSTDIVDLCKCLIEECVRSFRETRLARGDAGAETNFSDPVFTAAEQTIITNLPAREDITNLAEIKLRVCSDLYNRCNDLITAVKDLVLKGAFTGVDYQFSNGLSIFFPWSFLSLFTTARNYQKLDFHKDPRGKQWFLFLQYYTFFTARFPSSWWPILTTVLTEINANKNIDLDDLARFFGDGFGKDSPKNTRGMLEGMYYYYFGRSKNPFPILKIEGNIP